MALKLMGRKQGMTQLFDETGRLIVCTVIEIKPNLVTAVRTEEKEGYRAVQLGYDPYTGKDPRKRRSGRPAKPQQGFFDKQGLQPVRTLAESRVEEVEEFTVGQTVGLGYFAEVPFVDVRARSVGKGYQGLMKKKNFSGGPAAHGSGFHRHAGSTGMRSTPGRCLPGGPRPSQMGNQMVSVQNLRVMLLDEEEHLLLVKGAVPGPRNGLVYVMESVKRPRSSKVEEVKLWQS